MMKDGWGAEAAFPAIATLPQEQQRRIFFAMLPPSMTMMFAPGTVAYTLIRPAGVTATFAGSRPRHLWRLAAAAEHHRPPGLRRPLQGRERGRAQDLGAGRADQSRHAGRQDLALPAGRDLWPAGDDAAAIQRMAAREVPRGYGGLGRAGRRACCRSSTSRP